nr:hypothetical protein [Paenibacillus xylanexedens]
MISELIKMGECSTVDFESGTITVTFPDREGVVSRSLPLVIPAGSGQWNGLPRPKDTVLCVMLGNGLSNGFCVGRVPDVWPGTPGQEGVFFEDGSLVFYDTESATLHVNSVGAAVIEGVDTVTVKAPTVRIEGNLMVTGTVTAANIGG